MWGTPKYAYLNMLNSVSQSCLILCNPKDCSTPGFPVLHHLPEKLMSIESHVHWDVIQLSHSVSPPSPSALNLSQHQGLFQWVSSFIRLPKYWSFSFSISHSNEYSRLISFRIDWFDLLAVQRTLKGHLQTLESYYRKCSTKMGK